MRILALTMAGLLLGQTPSDLMYTNQRAMSVPIRVEDSVRTSFQEFLLFASWDEGRTYQLVERAPSSSKAFAFEARNEGTCWLVVAGMNRQGKQIPENVADSPEKLKLVIDTMKPIVKVFTAQRQGDDVEVLWEILEANFDPAGFRLEYQPKDNPLAWSAIQAPPGLTGKTRFRPSSAGPLRLRLIAKDHAKNQSDPVIDLTGAVSTVSYSQPASPAANGALPPPLPPPTPPPAIDTVPPPTSHSVPPPVADVKPTQPHSAAWSPPPGASPEPKDRLVASSDQPPVPKPQVAPSPVNTPPAPVELPRRPLPPKQYVNHPNILLQYSLSKVGKSGVGSVDLYMTRNDGQSWELHAHDKDVRGSKENGPQEATVEVPGEGVYGFALVVKSKAGLGKAPPRPGDLPEILIEVDTTPPLAELYAPVPDKQTGHLLLKWVAKDANLTNTPITLEWAKTQGDWHPIAKDIPNSGLYKWQLPENLPVEVYLRLRVRDLAGNESIAATQEPQLVDLSEPEGTIINASVYRRP